MKKTARAIISLTFAAALLAPMSATAEEFGLYTYTVTDGQATITDFNSAYAGALSITNTLGGCPVTSIGYEAFSFCTGLTSVTIPDGVTSIGAYGFDACFGLTSVTIPDSVTSIGDGAFYKCPALTSVTIPDGVTSIGDRAFYGCTALTSVTIPAGVTSINAYAFYYCPALTSVTIPAGVTNIGDYAFFDCEGLTSVTIPAGVTNIGDWAFSYCTSLTSVLFTGDAPDVGSNPFDQTPATIFYFPGTAGWGNSFAGRPATPLLTYVVDNGGVTISDIDEYFTGTFLTIPETLAGYPVISIGDSAFSCCSSLTSITILSSVTTIGDKAFSYCSALTSVTIPSSVTSIGYSAFRDCPSLTSVTIPESVTSIGVFAFSGCTALTSVAIPFNITTIGDWAFAYCSSLASVLFTGDAPTIDSYAFDATPATIYYLPAFAATWPSTLAGRPAVCWNPAVSPATPPSFATGQFGFTLAGNANIPVRVEACDSLASPVWTPVTNTNIPASGTLDFSDPASASQHSRFYRLTFPQ